MTSQAETFCRNRRLFDVRRGVVYLRRTENLAQHQWRHYGIVPAIRTRVTRDIGVTTTIPLFDDASSQHHDESLATTETRESKSDIKRGSQTNVIKESRVGDDETFGSSEREPRAARKVMKTRILDDFIGHPKISVTEVTDEKDNLNDWSPVVAAAASTVAETASTAAPTPSTAAATVSKAAAAASTAVNHLNPIVLPKQQHHPLLPPSDSYDFRNYRAVRYSQDQWGISPSVPAFRHPASTSTHDLHKFRQSHSYYTKGGGSLGRVSEDAAALLPEAWERSFKRRVDRNLMLATEDDHAVTTTTFTDSKKKSQSPKRYPLMSRVAGHGVGGGIGRGGRQRPRQLRTLTDFRSGNGTVRVIRPLPPAPGAMRAPVVSVYESDDNDDLTLDALQREKTYIMLKRIDRLLEPNRAYFVSDLTSSQVEVCSSSSSTSVLHDSLQDSSSSSFSSSQDDPADQVHLHRDNFRHYFSEEEVPGNTGTRTVSGDEVDPYQAYYDRIQARLARFYGHTLITVGSSASAENLSSLERRKQVQARRFHSEHPPLRQRRNDASCKRSPGDSSKHGWSSSRAQEDALYDRSRQGIREPLLPNPRPGAAHYYSHPRIPPLKNAISGPSVDSVDRRHSHSWNMRRRSSRTRVGGGRNGMAEKGLKDGKNGRRGWGNLRELVEGLEKEEVDLHLKCHEWIRASFS